MIILYLWSLGGDEIHFQSFKNSKRYVVLMNSVYGSSGSFVSRVRSKYIGNSTYTYRRSNFHSIKKPIH